MPLAWVTDDPGASSLRVGVARVRCGCWRCEGCGRRLRQLHCQLIEAGFADHTAQAAGRRDPFARFVTVTWPTDQGALIARKEDCAHTSAAFAAFVQELRRMDARARSIPGRCRVCHKPIPAGSRRRFYCSAVCARAPIPGRLEYYAVKEPTKRGRLHLHAITFGPYLRKCRRNLPGADANPCRRPGGCANTGRPCVQAVAHHLGLGWVDIRKVRGQRHAAAYIAKYLGKDHIGHPWPQYSRRAAHSRRFAPTTIGRLSREWSQRAYEAGVAAGHIDPTDQPDPAFTRWRLLDTVIRRGPPQFWLTVGPAVDRETGEIKEAATVDLTELAAIRRHNRRTEAEARLITGDLESLSPDTRRLVYAVASRQARTAP